VATWLHICMHMLLIHTVASGDSEMALYCLVLSCKRWLAFNNSILSALQGLFSNQALFF